MAKKEAKENRCIYLPLDVLANLFLTGRFSVKDLLDVSCVSRHWYRAASETMTRSLKSLSVTATAVEAQDLLLLIRRISKLERLELSVASEVLSL
jgi:hypothetical protein